MKRYSLTFEFGELMMVPDPTGPWVEWNEVRDALTAALMSGNVPQAIDELLNG